MLIGDDWSACVAGINSQNACAQRTSVCRGSSSSRHPTASRLSFKSYTCDDSHMPCYVIATFLNNRERVSRLASCSLMA